MSQVQATPLQRLADRLFRSGWLIERRFGYPSAWNRLLRIRLVWAMLLAAPALSLFGWYAVLAVGAHYRHVSAVGVREPLTMELVQLHLHDRLVQDFRRLAQPEAEETSGLPTYGLVLNNEAANQLQAKLPPGEGPEYYVEALVTRGNEVYSVEARYRGNRHWHWNHPQKSWKIRMKSSYELFQDVPTFNFVNTPDPLPFSEEVVLDLARQQGLLAPEYYPFRLQLNRAHIGIYFFETQADEGLIRKSNRAQGSVYSGTDGPVDPATNRAVLFDSPQYWRTVTARDDRGLEDQAELSELLSAVKQGTQREFWDYAERRLDVGRFASFDALDVVFGSNQHDYLQNHKLYFDPYRGRFEPIATDFRDFEHDPVLNRTENPLLLRLKLLPEYLTHRNQVVYDLLRHGAGVASLKRRYDELLQALEADQIRDPYWDAYELLPSMGKYYRQLVRPMNRELQSRAARERLEVQGRRERYLFGELTRQELQAESLAPTALPTGELATPVELSVGGHSGYALTSLGFDWPEDCRPEHLAVYLESDLDGQLDVISDRLLVDSNPARSTVSVEQVLYPAVRFRAQSPSPDRGAVRAEPAPQLYRLYVVTERCTPRVVRLQALHLVTGEPLQRAARRMESATSPPVVSEPCDDAPVRLAQGQTSLHPFCLLPREETIELGPGIVDIDGPTTYLAHQAVVIAAGTTLRLASQASLHFRGPVLAQGTTDEPICFEPRTDTWGGLVLQGPGTAGSRFEHVMFKGGSKPSGGFSVYPGIVDIHDTTDVSLTEIEFANCRQAATALHIAYVKGFRLEGATLLDVPADAIQIAFSDGVVSKLRTSNVDGEAIELSGSDAEITDSVLLSSGGAGVSVGERSSVTLRDSLTAQGHVGLLVKNDSTATVLGFLSYGDEVGVRVDPPQAGYSGRNRIRQQGLTIVDSTHPVQAIGKKTARLVDDFVTELGPAALPELRQRVLGLGDWSQLDARLQSLRSGGRP